MYQKAGAAFAAGGAGTLAYTGFGAVWIIVAGFALVAAGAALTRIVPRFGRRRDPAA